MKSLDKSIAEVGALIGDKTRATILISLMEGRSLTAGELALRANISPQTASNHLSKLIKAKLIVCECFGRHRYYTIASSDVASALEALSIITEIPKQALPHLAKVDKDLCFARTCYDHLAGELGVKITNHLLKKKIITLENDLFSVSNLGKEFFYQLGISTDALIIKRRHFAKPCLDWTERKHHLAGSLGAALLDYFMSNKLLMRSKQKPRVIILTTKGSLWINENLGFDNY